MPTAVLVMGAFFQGRSIRRGCLICRRPGNGGHHCAIAGFRTQDLAVARVGAIYGRPAPLEACASRPAQRAPIPSAWKRRCPPFRLKPPLKALSVVPQAMQEGTELLIEGREFACHRRHGGVSFFSSSVRSGDTRDRYSPYAERSFV